MNELVKRDDDAGTLTARIQFARALADASLLPAAYRKAPANVLVAIEYGRALGIDTMAAIQQVHIIEGKPSASAGLIGGLVRRAGHRLRVSGNREKGYTATIVRSDDPEFTFTATWTWERAQAAGLTGKQTWKSYPDAMLKARAITEVARDACPEVLSGVSYTPDELGDDQAVTVEQITKPTPEGVIQDDADGRTTAAVAAETVDGEVVEPGIEPRQTKRMAILMKEQGITDRNDALKYVALAVGHEVGSRNELTQAEASQVIAALEADVVSA